MSERRPGFLLSIEKMRVRESIRADCPSPSMNLNPAMGCRAKTQRRSRCRQAGIHPPGECEPMLISLRLCAFARHPLLPSPDFGLWLAMRSRLRMDFPMRGSSAWSRKVRMISAARWRREAHASRQAGEHMGRPALVRCRRAQLADPPSACARGGGHPGSRDAAGDEVDL